MDEKNGVSSTKCTKCQKNTWRLRVLSHLLIAAPESLLTLRFCRSLLAFSRVVRFSQFATRSSLFITRSAIADARGCREPRTAAADRELRTTSQRARVRGARQNAYRRRRQRA